MEGIKLQQVVVARLILFLVFLQGCPCQCQHQTPPKLTQQPSESIYYFSKSEHPNFALPCQANGTQPLRYWWERDGMTLHQSSLAGNLSVEAATEADIGNYTCFVSNDYGTAVSNTVQVQLAYLKQFDDSSVSLSPVEGTPFHVPCEAPSGNPSPYIYWKTADGTPLFSSGSSWNPTRSLAQDQDGNLVFLNTSTEDSGTYVCFASSSAFPYRLFSVNKVVNVQRASGEISRSPPAIRDSPVDVDALRGEDVKLYCLATGNPTPTVRWTRQDSTFRAEGPVLSLNSVQLEDEGVYTCTASGHGDGDVSETKNLHVESSPYWIEKPMDTSVYRGESARISCQASGVPMPRIFWMENGQRKPDNDDILSIEVNDVTEEDVKVYQCMASNAHGQIIANAILNMKGILQNDYYTTEKRETPVPQGDAASNITKSVLLTLLPILATFYLR